MSFVLYNFSIQSCSMHAACAECARHTIGQSDMDMLRAANLPVSTWTAAFFVHWDGTDARASHICESSGLNMTLQFPNQLL